MLPYNDYFEYYGPDYRLHMPTSNMENMNKRETLEEVWLHVFDIQLRLLLLVRLVALFPNRTLDVLWHLSWFPDQVSVVRDFEVTRSRPRGSNRDRCFGDQDPYSSGVAG